MPQSAGAPDDSVNHRSMSRTHGPAAASRCRWHSSPAVHHRPISRTHPSSLFKLVVIDLDDNDDAQIIFEVLNGRQTALSAIDLVKNLGSALDHHRQDCCATLRHDATIAAPEPCTCPEPKHRTGASASPRGPLDERGARVRHVCDWDTQLTSSGRSVVQHWAAPSVLSPHECSPPAEMALNTPEGASARPSSL